MPFSKETQASFEAQEKEEERRLIDARFPVSQRSTTRYIEEDRAGACRWRDTLRHGDEGCLSDPEIENVLNSIHNQQDFVDGTVESDEILCGECDRVTKKQTASIVLHNYPQKYWELKRGAQCEMERSHSVSVVCPGCFSRFSGRAGSH